MSSIAYYNDNAQLFYERTINANLSEQRERFLAQLNPSARILDVGCGVGRDAYYFEENGYDVTAFDGSKEMVKLANQILKRSATVMLFKELDYHNAFDGVWAAASLLHVPYHELSSIIQKIYNALRQDGIFFASFKHGEGEFTHEGRIFYFMTEKVIRNYLSPQFKIIDIWTVKDETSKYAPSPDRLWLNILAKKG